MHIVHSETYNRETRRESASPVHKEYIYLDLNPKIDSRVKQNRMRRSPKHRNQGAYQNISEPLRPRTRSKAKLEPYRLRASSSEREHKSRSQSPETSKPVKENQTCEATQGQMCVENAQTTTQSTQADSQQHSQSESSLPITSDMISSDGKIQMDELNSSPIKRERPSGTTNGSVLKNDTCLTDEPPTANYDLNDTNDSAINSSPLKTKKTVAFSDDLASEVSTVPDNSSKKCPASSMYPIPKKSILKAGIKEDNPNEHFSQDNEFNHNNFYPNKPGFWSNGTIVQLSPGSSLLDKLIVGTISVLKDRTFNKRFEAYASLNHNFKINRSDEILAILTQFQSQNSSPLRPKPQNPNSPSLLSTLSGIIQRDICTIESQIFPDDENKENTPTSPKKNDPFSTRIISQALKCASFLMSDVELNNCLSLDDIRWYYSHSASMIIKPTISKSLITPYISIIKECKFGIKKKKMLFSNGSHTSIPEHMLFAILNMKNFPSTSLICEKFITIKNLVQNFPTMMCNTFKHWFETFLMNLCDLNSPLHSKVLATAIISLLEISRIYLKNREVKFMVQQCLDRRISPTIRSFSGDTNVEIAIDVKSKSKPLVFDHVQSTILDLLAMKNYKSAMDIWIGITLLINDRDKGFENSPRLERWIDTLNACLVINEHQAKITAISAWKAVIYNLCVSDLDNLATPSKAKDVIFNGASGYKLSEKLECKFNLLFRLLTFLTLRDLSSDIIETIDSSILSIFYSVVNHHTLKNDQYFKIYWDRIIMPCFHLFYFSKTDLKQIPFLGAKLLARLMKKNVAVDEHKFVPIRCLSNDPVSLNEVNSINSRWAYQNHDRILTLLNVVVSLDQIKVGMRLSLISSYCNLVKPHLTNERTSATTVEIKNQICGTLKTLFDTTPLLTEEHIFKTFVTTQEVFGLENLVSVNTGEPSEFDFLYVIISKIVCLPMGNVPISLTKLLSSVDTPKCLPLVYSLRKADVQQECPGLIEGKIKGCKIDINSDPELKVAGMLFQDLTEDYSLVVKSAVQDIVLLNEKRFEQALNLIAVQRWSLPIFKYFILLIHDAPYNYMKQMAFNLILLRFESDDTFVNIIRFLVDNKFDLELFNIRRAMMKKFLALKGYFEFEFKSILKQYLSKLRDAGNFTLLDQFLVTCNEYNFDVMPIVKSCLNKLPLLQEAMDKPESTNELPESTSAASSSSKSDSAQSDSNSLLSDDESDLPDNTFSLETGNDPESFDDSFIAEQEATPEMSTDGSVVSKESSTNQKRAFESDIDDAIKRLKPNPSVRIEVPESNTDSRRIRSIESTQSISSSTGDAGIYNQDNRAVAVSGNKNIVTSGVNDEIAAKSKIHQLSLLVDGIEEDEIRHLSRDEREDLENKLLSFMLDIKRIK